MRILGIDPGYATTGWGVIDAAGNQLTAVAYGAITTPADQPFAERLAAVESALMAILATHQPAVLAIEELFFAQNTTTALNVAHARGVILLVAAKHGLPIREYKPTQVKQAITGYGHAGKQQMQRMIQTILQLPTIPKPDDVADALAVAIAGIQPPPVH